MSYKLCWRPGVMVGPWAQRAGHGHPDVRKANSRPQGLPAVPGLTP